MKHKHPNQDEHKTRKPWFSFLLYLARKQSRPILTTSESAQALLRIWITTNSYSYQSTSIHNLSAKLREMYVQWAEDNIWVQQW